MAFQLDVTTRWGFTAGFWRLDWIDVKRDEDSVVMRFHCYKDKAAADAGDTTPCDQRSYATDLATWTAAVQASEKTNPLAAIVDACETLAESIATEDWENAIRIAD